MRGQEKLQTGKAVFPERSIDTWNGQKEEVIMAKNVSISTEGKIGQI